MGKNRADSKMLIKNQYFEAPGPLLIITWSDIEEQGLLSLKVSSINIKDADVVISTMQMVGVARNINNLITTSEKTRLKVSFNVEEILSRLNVY